MHTGPQCSRYPLSLILALGSIFVLLAPLAAQAALFAPGATLDPGCPPTDSNCGIATTTTTAQIGAPFYTLFHATTTDALAEGTTNLYFTNARADARAVAILTATTSLPNVTTLANLSTVSTSLTGFLKATAGALSTTLINLVSDVTGILPIANGGTGWASIQTGTIPYGNGTNALATTTTGTAGYVLAYLNGIPTWTATTTFSSPLSYLNGTVSLNTSGDWAGTLGGHAGSYYSNATNLTNFGTPFYTYFHATTTDALAQGSTNLYWSNTLFDNRLSATISLPNITTLANLSLPATQLTNFGTPFYSYFHATTTDALAEGTTNLYFTNARAISALAGSANSYSLLQQFNGNASTTQFTTTGTTYLATLGGKVGIGTASPGYALDVVGNINSSGKVFASGGSLQMGQFGSGYGMYSQTTDMTFSRWTGSAVVSDITIRGGTGNVGIGEIALPAYQLDVLGNGHLSSYLDALYLVATSTTATSTFAGNLSVAGRIDANTYTSIHVSYEGDSIVSQGNPTWPNYIATYDPHLAKAGNVVNYGQSGDRMVSMVGEYATQAHLNRPTKPTDEGWFFLHGGGNDLVDGTSGATVYGYLQSIWASARADGYKVVAMTITPRGFTAPQEAQRQILNNLILSDPTQYDYVIRPDVLLNDPSNANYYYDTTHPTVLGAQLIAQLVATTINAKPWALIPTVAYNATSTMDLILNPTGINNKVRIGTTNRSTGDALLVTTAVGGNVQSSIAVGYTSPLPNIRGIFQHAGNGTNGNGGLQIIAQGAANGANGSGNINFLTSTGNSADNTTDAPVLSRMTINYGGNVGIGTTSPYAKFSIAQLGTDTSKTVFVISSSTAAYATTTLFSIANTGDVTINGSSGSSCTIGNGTGGMSCTSDENLKTNIALIIDPLKSIEQIRGVTFNWKDQTKDQSQFIGVIAQDVQKVFPQAVSSVGGYLSVDYASLVAPLIEAVKEIASISGEFKNNLIAWLGNTANGIGDLYVTAIYASTGSFSNELCVGSTCVTETQLKTILQNSGQQSTAAPAAAPETPAPDTTIAPATDEVTPPDDATVETPSEPPTPAVEPAPAENSAPADSNTSPQVVEPALAQ